jgi:acyl-CoA synthetase (AMP-forming)/AMP-acid ligase II
MEDDLSGLLLSWHQSQARSAVEMEKSLAATPSVAHLVSSSARLHGDALVLDFFEDGQTLSYAQLDTLSSQLAAGLHAAGLGSGDHMAVMLPNCLEFHITWIALAKLGAVMVPVNPTYTAREVTYVLTDSSARGWIVDQDLLAKFADVHKAVDRLQPGLIIGTQPGLKNQSPWHRLLAAYSAVDLLAVASPADVDTLLNIQYTSGTTGFPKGCMLTHGYWLTLAYSAKSMHLQNYRRFFTAQPFFYMDPFWQLLQTMLSGGCLVVAKKMSASKFFQWLALNRIEWAQLPELALKSMGEVPKERLLLKQVFTFGWSELSRLKFAECTGVAANESFGMTEIGLGLAMPPGWPVEDRSTSVGLAALNRGACVMVDEPSGGRPARVGEVGELWIKGAHLFKGYWNQPEANALAFSGEWFKTGDAFVCDSQGFYRIVGRFKDMIRRSSENIAAREVESVVRMCPLVLDCAVVPVPDPQRGEEVKVWVQWQPGHTASDTDILALLDLCKEHLAPFKIPRYVATMGEFPRTSSNKIAKHQLPEASATGSFDRLTGLWQPTGAAALVDQFQE